MNTLYVTICIYLSLLQKIRSSLSMNWEEVPRLTMVLDLPGQFHSKLPTCFCYSFCSVSVTLWTEPLFVFFLIEERGKEALPESCQAFEGSTAQSSGLVNPVLSRQTTIGDKMSWDTSPKSGLFYVLWTSKGGNIAFLPHPLRAMLCPCSSYL